MRWIGLALMCLGCGSAAPNNARFEMSGWFYAHALITSLPPDGDPVVTYDGPMAFAVFNGPAGEHSYFGALCGAREDHLICDYSYVDLTYGPGYAVIVTLSGRADADGAEFRVEIDAGSGVSVREWVITEVSTEPPAQAAYDNRPPIYRDIKERFSQ